MLSTTRRSRPSRIRDILRGGSLWVVVMSRVVSTYFPGFRLVVHSFTANHIACWHNSCQWLQLINFRFRRLAGAQRGWRRWGRCSNSLASSNSRPYSFSIYIIPHIKCKKKKKPFIRSLKDSGHFQVQFGSFSSWL